MIKIKCTYCKKDFFRFPNDVLKRNYCSRKCYFKGRIMWNKGTKGLMKFSKETRKKMSAAKKGKIPWNKGKKWRTKDRIRKQRKLYKAQRKIYEQQSGELTLQIIQRVYEDNIKKYGTLTCYLCKNPIPFGGDSLEHKTPLSRNGLNIYENLEIACKSCNSRKHNKTEEEYRKGVKTYHGKLI